MEGTAGDVVVDAPSLPRPIPVPREIQNKKDGSNCQFQPAVAMPDLLDAQPTSDPSSSDPSSDPSSDNTSPSSFLGTPYSTSLQFDYPFPISNAPRSDNRTPPLPSALPIASSLASAPSMFTAAAAASPASSESKDKSEPSPAMALPSLVSTLAANPDVPVNANLSEFRSATNKSTTSLASTHSGSGHGHGVMISQSCSASGLSISPPGSYQVNTSISKVPSPPATQISFNRRRGRHSLSISPVPPPSLSFSTGSQKPAASTGLLRRQNTNDSTMTNGTDASETSPRLSIGSVSSLSISNLQLLNLTKANEPPIPPSLRAKLPTFTRTSQSSMNSATSSYFSSKAAPRPTHRRTDTASTTGSMDQTSPPLLDSQSSTADTLTSPASTKSGSAFSLRPSLGRSNTHGGPTITSAIRPLFTRNHTSSSVQSRAYAQHLHDQQQEQMKLTEENKKKEEKEKKRLSLRRPSLSLRRARSSSSSSSSARSSSNKSKPSSINSKSPSSSTSTSSVALSGQERGSDDAVTESEGSTSPPIKGTKIRRRSSVRRALEKTGSLIGFNLNSAAVKRNGNVNGASP